MKNIIDAILAYLFSAIIFLVTMIGVMFMFIVTVFVCAIDETKKNLASKERTKKDGGNKSFLQE